MAQCLKIDEKISSLLLDHKSTSRFNLGTSSFTLFTTFLMHLILKLFIDHTNLHLSHNKLDSLQPQVQQAMSVTG